MVPLVAACSNCRQRVSRVGLPKEVCKETYFHWKYPVSFWNTPASASCAFHAATSEPQLDLLSLTWDKAGRIYKIRIWLRCWAALFHRCGETPTENIMRQPCSFAHFLHCTLCSILGLIDCLRTGTVSHLPTSLRCLAQGLTQSRCQVYEQALNTCWALTMCQALCWGLIIRFLWLTFLGVTMIK